MKVVEIFKSIDGEGKRAGMPATFIRLAFCNLRCTYCDTSYAFDDRCADDMTIDEIVHKCIELDCPSITLTGGEPLIHKDVEKLITELDRNNFDVNVETNGTIDPSYYHLLKNVWFTVDYKSPSSGCENAMKPEAFKTLRPQDVLKFVVGSDEDLEAALKAIQEYRPSAQVYFSPVFGYDAKNIVNFLLFNKLNKCKIQLQIHKYIWPVDMRGV